MIFKKEIPFIEYRNYLMGFSLLIIIISIIITAKMGINWGTDFKGGFKLTYQFKEDVGDSEIRDVLNSIDMGTVGVQRRGTEADKTFSMSIEVRPEIEHTSDKITAALEAKFGSGSVTLLEENAVGPKAGKELRRKGELAIIVSWLLILIYIGYRFDFYFAPGAILALIQDISITVAAFAISQREVDLTVTAALLTIVGYSINDTIVIYDRIRENLGKVGKVGLRAVANTSINETLSRTFITSTTVLLVVLILYFLSEGTIQDFAFAMIVGIISGVTSTLFIATPTFIYLKENMPALGEKIKKIIN